MEKKKKDVGEKGRERERDSHLYAMLMDRWRDELGEAGIRCKRGSKVLYLCCVVCVCVCPTS